MSQSAMAVDDCISLFRRSKPFPLVLGHRNQQLFDVSKQPGRRVKHSSDALAVRNATLPSRGLQWLFPNVMLNRLSLGRQERAVKL